MKNKVSLMVSLALLPSLAVASAVDLNKADLLNAPAKVKQQSYAPEISGAQSYSKLKIADAQPNFDYFIVQLEDAPLATYSGGVAELAGTAATDNSAFNLHSSASNSYKSYLASKQAVFAAQLRREVPGAKVVKSFDTLYNGVAVYGDKDKMSALAKLDGVKSVHPQQMFYATMDASLELINADKAWETFSSAADAGKGVRVAIVDSGIRPEHPMFSGEGFEALAETPEAFADDYCRTTDETFCNNKLLVTRYSEPTFTTHPDEYRSPLGYNGHGTHVAGTAVGNQVDVTYRGTDVTISGVAPGAYLMVYKGLFAGPDGRGSGSDIMLMEALERAVEDGADVINNSWGGSAGLDPAFSPYASVLAAIEAAGVVVSNSAGNSGNGAQTIGCPSCVDAGLSVANTTTGRFFANTVTVGGQEHMALDSTSPALSADITMPVVAAVNVEPENFEGCAPYADDTAFEGSIALVSRGSCAFTDKAVNAEAAGATGIVVYNNRPAQPIFMAIETTLPALMVSEVAGQEILASLAGGESTITLGAEIKRIIDSQYADNMATTSSRGPNGDANILKPDIAAPGTDILSAASPDTNNGSLYMAISGTSMASPHVAGAAALVKAQNPDWTATQIQTALTSTSVNPGLLDDDASTAADAFDVGAGRLDVERALNAAVTFNKPSMASAGCIGECSFARQITNMTDTQGEWTASLSFSDANVTGTVTPSTVELGALSSDAEMADFTVTVDTAYATPDSWVMGQLTWTHSSGQTAVMPVVVYANESSDSTLITNSSVTEAPAANAPISIQTAIANKVFTEEITVEVEARGGEIDADSAQAVVEQGTQTFLGVDESTGKLTWKGTLNTSNLSVDQSTIFGGATGNFFDLHEIAALGIPVSTYACPGVCDEFSFEVEYNFSYLGQDYTHLTVSDNGFIAPGSQNTSGAWNNQSLPSNVAPNNVLAPYWTDFNLNNGTDSDTGAGSIMYSRFNVGANVLVIQWDQVAVYGADPAQTYTFQVWILENTDTIWFTYGNLAATPSSLTIGAENLTGDTGVNYHYNGTGNADFTAFDTLRVNALIGGTVNLTYDAMTINSDNFTSADTADAVEEMPVMIDVLANDMGKGSFVTMSELASGDTVHKASKVVEVSANGGLQGDSITVTMAPANGTTAIVDGQIQYTPAQDFFGEDSFSYTVADAAGTVSNTSTVTVAVENVNDAPVLEAPVRKGVTEGTSGSVTVNSTDVDGDALTYNWTQISGPVVSFDNGGASISFRTPDYDAANNLMSFQVTASDGQLTSAPVMVTAQIQKQPSTGGGSMGWITLLLLPLALVRRRK